jgi:hypothetical protein
VSRGSSWLAAGESAGRASDGGGAKAAGSRTGTSNRAMVYIFAITDRIEFRVSGRVINIIPKLSPEELQDEWEIRNPKIRAAIRQDYREFLAGKTRPIEEFFSDRAARVNANRNSAEQTYWNSLVYRTGMLTDGPVIQALANRREAWPGVAPSGTRKLTW